MHHWLIGLVVGLPVLVLVSLLVMIGSIKRRRILNKCVVNAEFSGRTFSFKGNYYDKAKYKNSLKQFYGNDMTIGSFNDLTKEAKKRSLQTKDNELYLLQCEIYKEIIDEKMGESNAIS